MLSSVLVKGRGRREGYDSIATPDNGLLRWLSFGRLGVAHGHPYEGFTGKQECVIDILDGTVTIEVEGQSYRVVRESYHALWWPYSHLSTPQCPLSGIKYRDHGRPVGCISRCYFRRNREGGESRGCTCASCG